MARIPTFVIWGAIHGGALAIERKLTRGREAGIPALPKWLKRILIFHFVRRSAIFFRVPLLGAAWGTFNAITVCSLVHPNFPLLPSFWRCSLYCFFRLDFWLEQSGY